MSDKMLTIGRFVKIHGLESEKARQHNGKTAVIKKPISKCRVGVQPVGTEKVLAIKPSNLTILCSFCKIRRAQIEPAPIVCERCRAVSYCSKECKKKHWKEGANHLETNVPNCHEGWCIPLEFEMEPPEKSVARANNIGEGVYERTAKYLQLAADIGNGGRINEERVMTEKLLKVDSGQPGAYFNLFNGCHRLAAYAERYHPEDTNEFEDKAIRYLGMGIDLTVTHAKPDGKLGGQIEQMFRAWVDIVKAIGLKFIENCMQGERGEGNSRLLDVKMCLETIVLLFEERDESTYEVHSTLGFCCQKLMNWTDAIHHFDMCCKNSKGREDQDSYHLSLMQIPLCLSNMALYREDKSPFERVKLMEGAVTKSTEAISVLKAKDPKNAYMCQSKLCRILFNQNSLLNQFAERDEIEYLPAQKNIMKGVMSAIMGDALQGAMAARNKTEVEAIRDLQDLPFQ